MRLSKHGSRQSRATKSSGIDGSKLPLVGKLNAWLADAWKVGALVSMGFVREGRALLAERPELEFDVLTRRRLILPGPYEFLLAAIAVCVLLPLIHALRLLTAGELVAAAAAILDTGSEGRLLLRMGPALLFTGLAVGVMATLLRVARLVRTWPSGARMATSLVLFSLAAITLFFGLGKLVVRPFEPGITFVLLLLPLGGVAVVAARTGYGLVRQSPNEADPGLLRVARVLVALAVAASPFLIALGLVHVVTAARSWSTGERAALGLAPRPTPPRYESLAPPEPVPPGWPCSVQPKAPVVCDFAGTVVGLLSMAIDSRATALHVEYIGTTSWRIRIASTLGRSRPAQVSGTRPVDVEGGLRFRYPGESTGTEAVLPTNRAFSIEAIVSPGLACQLRNAVAGAAEHDHVSFYIEATSRDPVEVPEGLSIERTGAEASPSPDVRSRPPRNVAGFAGGSMLIGDFRHLVTQACG